MPDALFFLWHLNHTHETVILYNCWYELHCHYKYSACCSATYPLQINKLLLMLYYILNFFQEMKTHPELGGFGQRAFFSPWISGMLGIWLCGRLGCAKHYEKHQRENSSSRSLFPWVHVLCGASNPKQTVETITAWLQRKPRRRQKINNTCVNWVVLVEQQRWWLHIVAPSSSVPCECPASCVPCGQ